MTQTTPSIRPAFFALALLAAAAVPSRAQDPTADNVEALLALTSKACTKKLSGDYAYDDDSNKKAAICGDKSGAVYWTADMDIDCDGLETPGKCDRAHDCCFQSQTAFQNSKGQHLTAAVDPYYVIPNNFNLSSNGIAKWQIAAIIYKGKLTYAFLADTGPANIIGEASYATAVILGVDPDARTGGTDGPVTYIVFTGAIGRPTIPENHDQVIQVGTKAAQEFLKANGAPTALRLPALPEDPLRADRNSVQVNQAGRHALQVMDARGNTVLWKTGEGPTRHSLASLPRGVYYVRTVVPGARKAEPRRIAVH
jgi:hypothetical protein